MRPAVRHRKLQKLTPSIFEPASSRIIEVRPEFSKAKSIGPFTISTARVKLK
jgi:hypothetical protein